MQEKEKCLFYTALIISSQSSGEIVHTNSIGLAIFSSHHEWGFPCGIDTVHLSVVAQQQLKTLHMVSEGCCMQWGPAKISSEQGSFKKKNQIVFLFFM